MMTDDLTDAERQQLTALLSKRTKAGIAAAREAGQVHGGYWPRKLTPADVAEIRALYDAGEMSVAAIARLYEVNPTSIYAAMKRADPAFTRRRPKRAR